MGFSLGRSLRGIGRGLGRATGIHNFGDVLGYAGFAGGLGIGGGLTGQILQGAGMLGGMTGGPEMPPGYDELMRRAQEMMNNPQGYSPEEQARMKAELIQAITQQRNLAQGQLRAQATQQGTLGSGGYALQQGRIQSGYADALSSGIADIMGQSEAQRRQSLQMGMSGMLQALPMGFQAQQNYQANLGNLGSQFGYQQGMGQGQPAPMQTMAPAPAGTGMFGGGYGPRNRVAPFAPRRPGYGGYGFGGQ